MVTDHDRFGKAKIGFRRRIVRHPVLKDHPVLEDLGTPDGLGLRIRGRVALS